VARGAISNSLFMAITTVPHNGQMPKVSDEPIFPEQCILEGTQKGLIKVNYGTTLATNEVMMMAFFGGMVPDPSSPQVGLGDHAKPFQEVKGAVDSRDIYIGEPGNHLAMNFLGANVVIAIFNSR
jgi:hypothetical protein